MTRRDCGTCTMCCLLTEVPELKKPIMKWCEFCDQTTGCKEYTTRPQSCRDFFCHWVLSDAPDTLRPDRCGVVLEELLGEMIVLVLVDPQRPDSWNTPEVFEYAKLLRDAGYALLVAAPWLNKKPTMLPKGCSIEEVEAGLKRFAHNIGKT